MFHDVRYLKKLQEQKAQSEAQAQAQAEAQAQTASSTRTQPPLTPLDHLLSLTNTSLPISTPYPMTGMYEPSMGYPPASLQLGEQGGLRNGMGYESYGLNHVESGRVQPQLSLALFQNQSSMMTPDHDLNHTLDQTKINIPRRNIYTSQSISQRNSKHLISGIDDKEAHTRGNRRSSMYAGVKDRSRSVKKYGSSGHADLGKDAVGGFGDRDDDRNDWRQSRRGTISTEEEHEEEEEEGEGEGEATDDDDEEDLTSKESSCRNDNQNPDFQQSISIKHDQDPLSLPQKKPPRFEEYIHVTPTPGPDFESSIRTTTTRSMSIGGREDDENGWMGDGFERGRGGLDDHERGSAIRENRSMATGKGDAGEDDNNGSGGIISGQDFRLPSGGYTGNTHMMNDSYMSAVSTGSHYSNREGETEPRGQRGMMTSPPFLQHEYQQHGQPQRHSQQGNQDFSISSSTSTIPHLGPTTFQNPNPLEALLPRSLLYLIIDLFFDYVFPLTPCLHKPTFYRDLYSRREEKEGEEEWTALVMATVSLTLLQVPGGFIPLSKREVRWMARLCYEGATGWARRGYKGVTVNGGEFAGCKPSANY